MNSRAEVKAKPRGTEARRLGGGCPSVPAPKTVTKQADTYPDHHRPGAGREEARRRRCPQPPENTFSRFLFRPLPAFLLEQKLSPAPASVCIRTGARNVGWKPAAASVSGQPAVSAEESGWLRLRMRMPTAAAKRRSSSSGMTRKSGSARLIWLNEAVNYLNTRRYK